MSECHLCGSAAEMELAAKVVNNPPEERTASLGERSNSDYPSHSLFGTDSYESYLSSIGTDT